MAREWGLEAKSSRNGRTLEGMLIEVYGCMPLNDNRVINLYASRDRKRDQKALYFSEQLVDSKAV